MRGAGKVVYHDTAVCPYCKLGFKVARKRTSIGRIVDTHCPRCRKGFKVMAGEASD